MYKWIRIAIFTLPLAGGAAFAQGSGTSGSAGAPGTVNAPPVTNDTRTPTQEKAGRIDDTNPALPGDATKPVEVPNTVRNSNRNGMPAPPKVDESTLPRRHDTTEDKSGLRDSTKTNGKLDHDLTRDQLDSDK